MRRRSLDAHFARELLQALNDPLVLGARSAASPFFASPLGCEARRTSRATKAPFDFGSTTGGTITEPPTNHRRIRLLDA